ncbi:hypothetical protein CHS0354_015201 [Potamilus streckersoni]|uniref:Short-chain collagen C4-like n=1 Tax=Potamilus streckersoni TaxID=2493646 RepID=A0AAE0SD65_9BIVA|nr:hypothetical protein CHS0354_015201 [Potamilus streckersoni]
MIFVNNMIKHTEAIMSKLGVRGLAILLGLVMVVCLAVLQMKSLSDLHELGLTVSAMKRNKENNIEKDLDKTGRYEKISMDAVYGQDDERLMKIASSQSNFVQPPKRERRRREVDDIDPVRDNTTMNKNDQHIHTPTGTGGAVYTRWGRTTCPGDGNTEIIYSGISAGSWYDHTGAAVNTLCLPHEPIWGTYTDSLENLAFIYGAEYHDHTLFKLTNAEALLYHNMPCAVCRSRLRTSTFMLPARNRCFGDWHVEYHGYLMTGHSAHKASTDYICVDQAPEADPSGFRTENGRQLYRVEAICGSLPCPQYMQGRELTCAVCSK